MEQPDYKEILKQIICRYGEVDGVYAAVAEYAVRYHMWLNQEATLFENKQVTKEQVVNLILHCLDNNDSIHGTADKILKLFNPNLVI